MAAKKKTTKKTAAGQQRSSTKRSPAKKKPVGKTGSRPVAKKAPAKKTGGRPAAQKAPAKKTAKELSALDAAAQVLAETNQPMNCREMIEAMAKRGYWTSPAGKTPSATLYSAIVRELKSKGAAARFEKVERGRFALSQDAR
jgi:hypothetical protein